MKNIELYFKTKNYKRIKVGISNDKNINTKNYVLGKFSNDDSKLIEESLNKIVNVINDFPNMTFENLMNKYN